MQDNTDVTPSIPPSEPTLSASMGNLGHVKYHGSRNPLEALVVVAIIVALVILAWVVTNRPTPAGTPSGATPANAAGIAQRVP